jgi:endothelin-converting enzyme/putative endopeptidase
MRRRTRIAAAALIAAAATSAPPTADAAPQGVYLGDIDRAADPCTDFYAYANGAWRAANPIPASQVRWSRRWAAGDSAKEQLRVILDEVSARSDWPRGSVEQLVGDSYAACMDQAAIDARGARPLQPLLQEIAALPDVAAVQAMIARLHGVGIRGPFGLFASPDRHQPGRVIAHLGPAGLGLPDRDYYLRDEPRFVEAREKYLAHVTKLLELAGVPAAAAKAEADTVFAFEKELAEASLDRATRRDPHATDHLKPFAELVKLTPRLDWVGYFAAAQIPPGDVNVREPKHLARIDQQLASTPLPTWKSYLRWRLVDEAAEELSSPFVREHFDFHERFLGGAQEMKPRWKHCVETTDELLGEALGRKYVERHFPPEAKARMEAMVENLQLAMGETIRGLDWMSAETKAKALEKLATFVPKIGYPDQWKDYSSVAVRRDTHFANVEAGARFTVADDVGQIGKPTDRGRWGMTPPTSNAYYNPSLNEIVFPAGILQPPAFRLDATDAVNYGAIGVVIGHEISHGFDDQGAKFDAQGRLRNWWSDADLAQFQARGKCVADQFEGYFVEPGIHHNGKLVLGESIGDLAGAKIAFRAYQLSRRGKAAEPTIDGFTPEQQFFIGWGQFRGDAIRPETQRLMVQTDPHPTGKYRVVGPLSNMPEFQQTFGCKTDAAMVRPAAQRCAVW